MEGELERKEDYRAVFYWTLKAFSLLDKRVDRCCYSPPLSFCGRRWGMHLLPNRRESGQSEGDVVLRLYEYLSDLFPPLKGQYSVGIRTKRGFREVRASETFGIALVTLISRSELFRRREELLPRDTLTLTLELEVADGSSETELTVPFSSRNFGGLSLDLSKVLKDQVSPDVKLKCGERTFSAHRIVLVARSEVFAAMFRNRMSESETGVVDISDLDAPVLDLLLQYMYTGDIQDVSEDLVPGMYAACDKYAVHSLKKACSDQMIAGLTEGNCITFLSVADAHSDTPFKEQVVSFMCGNEAILQSEVWLSFAEKHSELANEVYQSCFRSKSRTSVDSRPSFSGDGANDELAQPVKRRKFCC